VFLIWTTEVLVTYFTLNIDVQDFRDKNEIGVCHRGPVDKVMYCEAIDRYITCRRYRNFNQHAHCVVSSRLAMHFGLHALQRKIMMLCAFLMLQLKFWHLRANLQGNISIDDIVQGRNIQIVEWFRHETLQNHVHGLQLDHWLHLHAHGKCRGCDNHARNHLSMIRKYSESDCSILSFNCRAFWSVVWMFSWVRAAHDSALTAIKLRLNWSYILL
jgi:hypothetical protein